MNRSRKKEKTRQVTAKPTQTSATSQQSTSSTSSDTNVDMEAKKIENENKPEAIEKNPEHGFDLKPWLSGLSPLTATLIILGTKFDVLLLVGIGCYGVFLFINLAIKWQYKSKIKENTTLSLWKTVRNVHFVLIGFVILVPILWATEEYVCTNMPEWANQRCERMFSEKNTEKINIDQSNTSFANHQNKTVTSKIQGNELLIISIQDAVHFNIDAPCLWFGTIPLAGFLLGLITFIALLITEKLAIGMEQIGAKV